MADEKDPKAEAPALDDILVALQKSLSRVSAKTREVSSEQARAMIVGKVSFEMTLRIRPENDTLRQDPAGAVELTLQGTVLQDVRAERADERRGDGEPEEPQPDTPGSSGSEDVSTGNTILARPDAVLSAMEP